MIDAISGALSAVTSIRALSKELSQAKTETEIAAKTRDLNERLGDALDQLIAAQTEHLALLGEKADLEAEILKLHDWAHEKQRYQLHQTPAGSFVYRLKPGMEGGEPPHDLCANCYQQGIKSILQACEDGWYKALKCHRCGSVMRTEKIQDSGPNVVFSECDPFGRAF